MYEKAFKLTKDDIEYAGIMNNPGCLTESCSLLVLTYTGAGANIIDNKNNAEIRVVYPARTYRKNTWVLGISWVLGVPISDVGVPSQFLYG